MCRRIGQIFVVIICIMLLTGCSKTVYRAQDNGVAVLEEVGSEEEAIDGFCMGIITDIEEGTVTIAVFSATEAGNTMNGPDDKEDAQNTEKPYHLDMTEQELQFYVTDQTAIRIDNYENSEEGSQDDIQLNSAVCVKYDTQTLIASAIIIKVL